MRKIGQKIHHYNIVDSTNAIAKKLAAKGEKEGTVIIAETQRNGRGRLGRKWESPKGGIWLSLILRPKIHASKAPLLTFMASVAVAKAIHETLRLKVEVKWPNDVLIENKKVCGILIEANTRGNTINFVVVGVGINVNVDLDSFPPGIRNSATSLKTVLHKDIDKEKFLQALFEQLERYYELFLQEKYGTILAEWKSLAMFLGKPVEVACFREEKFRGKALGVDENGALILQLDDGTVKKVVSGDVTLLRKF